MSAALAALLDYLRPDGDPELVVAMANAPFRDQWEVLIFSMAGGKPRLLTDLIVPEAQASVSKERIRESRVATGLFHPRHVGWFWSATPERFRLWSPDRIVLEGKAGRLQLPDGTFLDITEVAGVEPYVTPNWSERGVRLVTGDGGTVTVASDTSCIAEVDPTYDDDLLEWDTGWARLLARTIAEWLHVRYVGPQWADTPRFD